MPGPSTLTYWNTGQAYAGPKKHASWLEAANLALETGRQLLGESPHLNWEGHADPQMLDRSQLRPGNAQILQGTHAYGNQAHTWMEVSIHHRQRTTKYDGSRVVS